MKGYTTNSFGKEKRMSRIFGKNGRCVIVPLDDNLISGPFTGVSDWLSKISQIEVSNPNAILGFQGSLMKMRDFSIPQILNLSASTIQSCHTNKVLVNTLNEALRMDVDAVAMHINFTSRYENRMIEILGSVSEKCDIYGIPLLVIAYPRQEIEKSDGAFKDENYISVKNSDNEKYTDMVCHCVRAAFELGADIIKTMYTGSEQSFKRVVQSASGCPVIISGGEVIPEEELYLMVEEAMRAGSSGVCVGRNVFCRKNSDEIVNKLKEIVNKV